VDKAGGNCDEELHDPCSSLASVTVIRVMKSVWVGHVPHVGVMIFV